MLRIFHVFFACIVVIPYTTFGVEAGVRFGMCTLYFRNENLPEIENGDRFCFHSEMVKVCRETPCPNLSCDRPLPPSASSNCSFCPGQCVNGGKVYRVGQRFKHTDGQNFCNCRENNRVLCSKLPTNEIKLCMDMDEST